MSLTVSRAVRFFSNAQEQEAETLRFWSTRTIDQRLEALAELLRNPHRIEFIDPQRDGEISGMSRPPLQTPTPRVVRLFKSRDEQEAWNDGKRP